MRGTTNYFLKYWRGNPKRHPASVMESIALFLPFLRSHYRSWSYVEVVADGLRARQQQGNFGVRAGGGWVEDAPEVLLPGRRLWNQTGFNGAQQEGQIN